MGIIFGPDTFTTTGIVDIASWPSGGDPDYAYSRGSAGDIDVDGSIDTAVCANNTNVDLVARVIDPAVPQNMEITEVRGTVRCNNNTDIAGVVLNYSTSTRGYILALDPSQVNEVRLLEDDAGVSLITSVDRGLVNSTDYPITFRAVRKGASSEILLTCIIGPAGTSSFTFRTGASSDVDSGAPGMYFKSNASQDGRIDNLVVDDLAGYPLVSNMAVTNGTTATTTPSINIPNTIQAGDTLIVIVRNAEGGTITFPNEGTEWIQLFEDSSDASNDTVAAFWKKATGTEGFSFSATFSVSGKFSSVAYRITNAADPTTRPPEFATLAIGTTTTPDPGTVTPTGGTKKYLFIWVGTWSGEQTSPPTSAFPANYNHPLGANSGTGGAAATNCQIATLHREAEVSSENPGSWTISAAPAGWTATVIAVHPIGASEFMPAIRHLHHSGGWIGGGHV